MTLQASGSWLPMRWGHAISPQKCLKTRSFAMPLTSLVCTTRPTVMKTPDGCMTNSARRSGTRRALRPAISLPFPVGLTGADFRATMVRLILQTASSGAFRTVRWSCTNSSRRSMPTMTAPAMRPSSFLLPMNRGAVRIRPISDSGSHAISPNAPIPAGCLWRVPALGTARRTTASAIPMTIT